MIQDFSKKSDLFESVWANFNDNVIWIKATNLLLPMLMNW